MFSLNFCSLVLYPMFLGAIISLLAASVCGMLRAQYLSEKSGKWKCFSFSSLTLRRKKHHPHKTLWEITIKTDTNVNDYYYDILHFMRVTVKDYKDSGDRLLYVCKVSDCGHHTWSPNVEDARALKWAPPPSPRRLPARCTGIHCA